MAFQYNIVTSNMFEPLVKHKENKNAELCQKLFEETRIDYLDFKKTGMTDMYYNYIVQLYQTGIKECKDDVRVFTLCELLVNNIYYKDEDLHNQLIKLRPDFCNTLFWRGWHDWSDISIEFPFKSMQSRHGTKMT